VNGTNLFKIALKAIANNKMRSFLTMLGIIIGVASVITMLAIGQGSKQSIKQNIAEMGSNMIMINPGADRGPGGARMSADDAQSLTLADYQTIVDQNKYLAAVSPNVSSGGQLIYGNNNYQTSVTGVSQGYLEIRQLKVESGEMFTDADIKASAKVCVIGKTIVDELFPDGAEPVGKMIRFKSIPFRIVGVLKSKGYNSWGMDQDNVIIAPYTTVMKRLLAQTYYSNIVCSAITEEMSNDAIDELTQILRTTHKLKDDQEDDFTIRSQQEMMETMTSTMDTITVILVVAAAFSLLVAGIGIMNIMLVSVTERTKEIGLRMSVGARGIDISNQFLIESIMISITGGIIGVIVGWAGTYVCDLFDLPTSTPLWSIIVSFAVCTVIGVGFGYFPAQKAANMDPIEAIRYE
jgi:putative ABC transport system permease protein